MLSNGNLLHTPLTADDVDNANQLFGKCEACLSGKVTELHFTPSEAAPAGAVGDHLYIDLIDLDSKSIGGFTWYLIVVDEHSSYLSAVGMRSKSQQSVFKALRTVISSYNALGHKVTRITSDAERTILATAEELGLLGVLLTETIPGEHQKRCERYIRTIKDRQRCVLASLSYALPADLFGELLTTVVNSINVVPNSTTGTRTPFELFQKRKVDIRSLALLPFGEPVMVKTINTKGIDAPRMEHGIVLGWQLHTPGAVRAYIPHRHFVAVRNVRNVRVIEDIPAEWKWERRIPALPMRVVTPTLNEPVQPGSPELEDVYPEEDVPLDGYSGISQPVQSQGGDVVEPVSYMEPIPSQGGAQAHYDSASADPPLTAIPEGVVDAPDEPAPDPVPDTEPLAEPLTIRIPRHLWDANQTEATVTVTEDETEAAAEQPESSSEPDSSPPTDTEVLHVSVEAALKTEHGDSVRSAVQAELQNMADNDVWNVVSYSDIPRTNQSNIVPSHMFIKFKYRPDGTFQKTKARLVAQGNHQHASTYGKTASKTVNIILVFLLIKLMTAWNLKAKVYDINGAYLNTPRTNPKKLYMMLSPSVATEWVKMHPEHASMLHRGCLYVELKKCIYGLKEAAFEFYLLLSNFLKENGYKQSSVDDCLFTKYDDENNFTYVVTHVDDLLVTGRGKGFQQLESALEKRFGSIDIQHGSKFSYLGMTIERDESRQTSELSQFSIIKELLIKNDMETCQPVDNPCACDFLDDGNDEELCDLIAFLSLCMALMFIARMTRPDILFAITYLSSKASKPTKSDMKKLKRVLRYLKGTIDKKLLMSGSDLSLNIYADASYGIHADGKSHSGVVIALGKDPIFNRSSKQTCVSLSSTEAEIITLVDAMTYIEWLERAFEELCMPVVRPVTVFQDNQSAIHMVTNELKFKRTKHMTVKTYYAREMIVNGRVSLRFLRSEDMLADILTKSMPTKTFVKLSACFIM